MRNRFFLSALCLFISNAYAQTPDAFDTDVNAALQKHYHQYKDLEYFSGAALSVSVPKQEIKNYYVGTTSHNGNSRVSADTLFQIGSITKSFTSAILLQLDKENLVRLESTVKNWFPQYSKWGNLTVTSLLNMTSGLPNYSDSPLMNAGLSADPSKSWSGSDLINLVYPKEKFSPPLRQGYFYTNTSYTLSGAIIEKATHHSLQDEITNRLIKPAQLKNTFYPLPTMQTDVQGRLAQGYGYNQYDNPELLGKDINDINLSWAGAAGAIVSNSEDIVKWVTALFIDNTILDAKQKSKLTELVSITSGKPVKKLTATDSQGFGLGVAEGFNSKIGYYWFYEGETLGFRSLYMYVPCNHVIIATTFNSATNNENDHIKDLIQAVYKIILRNHLAQACKIGR